MYPKRRFFRLLDARMSRSFLFFFLFLSSIWFFEPLLSRGLLLIPSLVDWRLKILDLDFLSLWTL